MVSGPGLQPPVRLAWFRFLVKVRGGCLPPRALRWLSVSAGVRLSPRAGFSLQGAASAPRRSLKASFRECQALTRALGIPEAASRRYEADDLLALAARRGRPRPVVLMSTDKDLLQLLQPGDWRWTPGAPAPESYAQLRESLGFPPEAMATYLALTGDASDGIPGVPGIGAKTAARLCARFADLPALYEALEAQGSGSGSVAGAAGIARKLLHGREAAYHAFT